MMIYASEEKPDLEMKEYSDEELLDIDNILDDDEESPSDEVTEDSTENNNEYSSVLENPETTEENINENIEEESASSEEKPDLEMKEYSDEELLDIDNILDDDEESPSDEVTEDSTENNNEDLSVLENPETTEENSEKDSDTLEDNSNDELSLDKYTLIELEDGTKVKRTSYAKDNIDVEDAEFSDEQNYVVQHKCLKKMLLQKKN